MSEAVAVEYAMQCRDNKVSVLYDNLETHLILHILAGQLLISLVHRRIWCRHKEETPDMLHITAEVKGVARALKRVTFISGKRTKLSQMSSGRPVLWRRRLAKRGPGSIIHVSEFSHGAWKSGPFVGHKMALAFENAGEGVTTLLRMRTLWRMPRDDWGVFDIPTVNGSPADLLSSNPDWVDWLIDWLYNQSINQSKDFKIINQSSC